MANTTNIDLENINILPDDDLTYNQIVTELIAKINNNNQKIDTAITIIDGGTF